MVLGMAGSRQDLEMRKETTVALDDLAVQRPHHRHSIPVQMGGLTLRNFWEKTFPMKTCLPSSPGPLERVSRVYKSSILDSQG